MIIYIDHDQHQSISFTECLLQTSSKDHQKKSLYNCSKESEDFLTIIDEHHNY